MYFASYDDKEIARLGLSFNDIYFLEWFINYQHSNKMEELPDKYKEDDRHYYWLKYTKIIYDLPALQINNNASICKMVNRICGKGKNENEYPLIKITKNVNNKNKSYYAIRWEVISKMKGFSDELGIEDIPKKEKKELIGSLNPNVERILIELDKLCISDGKRLFSFTLPTDHKIHTKSMKHFQDACYDLYEGRFNSRHPLAEWFKEKNYCYISNKTVKEVNDCKGNWNQISMVLQCAARNYITWFELDRESENKEWLTRDIGSFMYYPIKQTSMFYITIMQKASKTREVIAENTYNRLPTYIQNKFMYFYNDEWDSFAYWNRIYSVYKWYKDNAEDLIEENINYRYWLDGGSNKFMEEYFDFLNNLGRKYLKHFGTKCQTWDWFISQKKDEHGIDK